MTESGIELSSTDRLIPAAHGMGQGSGLKILVPVVDRLAPGSARLSRALKFYSRDLPDFHLALW
jgi:hypothetical protein